MWKYLDDGSDQGTAWREPGFDDSLWKSGPAQLGYGETDQVTTIGFGPDEWNKYPTTYFRHRFEVADPASIRALELQVLRDDGVAVFLNGREVLRDNLRPLPIMAPTRDSHRLDPMRHHSLKPRSTPAGWCGASTVWLSKSINATQ